ncbi:MAG: hypothetical protein M0Z80_08370 [Treponema sp.]|nr:hypothetical protein [Treponema sp.]
MNSASQTVRPALERLKPMVARGLDRAAEVLAALLDASVGIAAPEMSTVHASELQSVLGMDGATSISAVEMNFSGRFGGAAQLIFLSEDAGRLADCVTSGLDLPEHEMESMRSGTLCEVGNVVINAILGTIANGLAIEFCYTVPLYLHGKPEEVIATATAGEGIVILVRARFRVAAVEVEGDIAFFLSLDTMNDLVLAVESLDDER